jgi:hypothetical protein
MDTVLFLETIVHISIAIRVTKFCTRGGTYLLAGDVFVDELHRMQRQTDHPWFVLASSSWDLCENCSENCSEKRAVADKL